MNAISQLVRLKMTKNNNGHGGKRNGAGRPKGSKNNSSKSKVTVELKVGKRKKTIDEKIKNTTAELKIGKRKNV